MITMDTEETKEKLMRELEKNKVLGGFGIMLTTAIFVIATILGLGTGYYLSKIEGPRIGSKIRTTDKIKTAQGVKDEKKFPDKVEGKLKEGGIDGEGNYHLERPGGKSQNVYLTSSTIDLSKFIGKKVRVWGQTFSAQTAGWLMDVGYIEVL
jgi:hypothetical protein